MDGKGIIENEDKRKIYGGLFGRWIVLKTVDKTIEKVRLEQTGVVVCFLVSSVLCCEDVFKVLLSEPYNAII